MDLALVVVQEHSEHLNLVAFTLATVRRLASSSRYKEQVAKHFLYTLMIFVKLFLASHPDQTNLPFGDKLGTVFVYKEILGCLGVLAVDAAHRKEVLENDGAAHVVMSARLHLNKPKLVKTALGCLINLAQDDGAKDHMSKSASFYFVIYTVLDQYEKKTPLIDYTLRLILNTTDNELAYQNFISGSLLQKLLVLLEQNQKNDNLLKLIKLLKIHFQQPNDN